MTRLRRFNPARPGYFTKWPDYAKLTLPDRAISLNRPDPTDLTLPDRANSIKRSDPTGLTLPDRANSLNRPDPADLTLPDRAISPNRSATKHLHKMQVDRKPWVLIKPL
jgi:hypothetical protein